MSRLQLVRLPSGVILCAALAAVAVAPVGTAAALTQERQVASQEAQTPPPVTPEEKKAVVEEIARLLVERYVFEDKGQEAGEHISKLLADGKLERFEDARELAAELTAQLQSVTNDKHLRVGALRPGGPRPMALGAMPSDPAELLMRLPPPRPDGNFGFEKLESLPGNIGYLKLDGFATGPEARQVATAAMNYLAGSDAVIIDLRENGGGNPSMVQFVCSYLFDTPTHLNSLYWREGDVTEEFWTSSDVPGARPGREAPLYVLTSGKTFSGGEEFAYNIQTQKRGTLIGETTGGGANPGGVTPVGERFAVFIPTGRAINPVTGTNWEGVGVKPEIEMPADQALEKAIELATQAAAQRREKRRAEAASDRQAVVSALQAGEEELAKGVVPAALAEVLEQAMQRGSLKEADVNLAGYACLQSNRLDEGIALLRWNAQRFPSSPNAHDSLGEALEKAGRLREAQAAYRQAHDLGVAEGDGQVALYRRNLDRVSDALAGQ